LSIAMFQSTHPHGMRRQVTDLSKIAFTFQSTHPHGMRHLYEISPVTRAAFQSTHPHGMRLYPGRGQGLAVHVSIHAPTWDATQRQRSCIVFSAFQSTHPHGMRLEPIISSARS